MSMYWIYDISNAQLAFLTIGVFVSVSLLGLFISRPIVRRLLDGSPKHNDIVSFFFAGIGVFYGLALGLIAVATWEDFVDVENLVSKEAAAVAALYRDLDGYPPPLRSRFETELKEYVRLVIERDWPAHRRGEVPEESTEKLDDLEDAMMEFEPASERQKIAHVEAMSSLNAAVELHRLRLQAVSTGLPASLWAVVIIGALLNIKITYLFWVENLRVHAMLIAMLATFIGLLIFLTAAMDNPFRGEFSVSPEAFEDIYVNVMKVTKK
jgi:hypothetical protein